MSIYIQLKSTVQFNRAGSTKVLQAKSKLNGYIKIEGLGSLQCAYIMMMVMKNKMAVTQAIFKLVPPYFSW